MITAMIEAYKEVVHGKGKLRRDLAVALVNVADWQAAYSRLQRKADNLAAKADQELQDCRSRGQMSMLNMSEVLQKQKDYTVGLVRTMNEARKLLAALTAPIE